jgi:phage-related protein
MWNGIVEWFSGIIESIVNFFTVTIPEAWETFKMNLQELCDSIVQWFQDAWNSVIAFFTETIPAWIQSVIDWFNQLPYNIGYMIGQIIGHFIQWGIDLKNFVTEDIPAFITSVVEWFKSLPGKIWEWLKSAWEKVKTWGSNIYTSARDWVSKTIDSVVDWFRSLPGKIWTWLTNAVSKVRAWGSDLWNTGINAAKQLVDSVVQKAKELPGKMVDIGINLIKGLWEGIGSVKDWILDKISGFCDGIVDGMLDFFGIHSPSRLLRDLVGKMLPPGIAVGFEMAMPKSTKDILNEVDGMNAELQKQVNANVNDIGVPLETNARITQQQSVVNAFPKTMQLVRNGVNEFKFVLDNGAEVAHWLAPEMGVELAELR